jgi:uncharacterized protein with HEPN domain
MDDRDRRHLESLAAHAAKALDYVRNRGSAWYLNDETTDAVMMQITQVGEDARRVSDETLATIPGIAWRQVKGIREQIVHDYEFVDVEIVKDIVEHSLPDLIEAVGLVPRR